MPPVSELVRSVEIIWPVWLTSLILLVCIGRRVLRTLRWRHVRTVLTAEEGAAYSLAYVMTVPFFLFLVCLVIETSLMLVVKMGTLYAAYASARSAIVWRSADASRINERVQRAAVEALTPFASSSAIHADGPPMPGVDLDAAAYARAYRRYSSGPASTSYLHAKYLYASKATSVLTDKPSSAPDGTVAATVTYEMPLHLGVIGRVFGKRSPWGGRYYTVTIASSAALPDETPRSADGTLGINYVSP